MNICEAKFTMLKDIRPDKENEFHERFNLTLFRYFVELHQADICYC